MLSSNDADADGIVDFNDNCPKFSNPKQLDSDNDLEGDVCDADDDNDGRPDAVDDFDNNPFESRDYDFDKLGDNVDPDDDNDNIIDAIDAFDKNPREWADFDFDGVGSKEDPDDDNDGIMDISDSTPILLSEELAVKYLGEIQDCALVLEDTLRLLCYSEFFGRVVDMEKNSTGALELSIALSKLGTIDDCHFVSHEIGHVAYNERPNVFENLEGMDGSMCRGGYFHGILASYFHSIKESGEPLSSTYDTICDDLIGSSNYQDCIHGLGHGLVHYFDNDLDSSIKSCHEMSFYQNILCMKGVMMQYTDNTLTREGISQNILSNLCVPSELEGLDFQECSMSIGTTLAFHTNHDFEKGAESCKLIGNKESMNYCLEGLNLEIKDSERYDIKPLNQEIREKYQPQFIDENSVIDIRSPAIISDFLYSPETKQILFKIDRPSYVIMYLPVDLIPEEAYITVNGKQPKDFFLDTITIDQYAVIQFTSSDSGIVIFSPVK